MKKPKDKKQSYRRQHRVSLLMLLSEFPGLVAIFVAAFFSGSVLVWLDAVDTFGYSLRAAVTMGLSKKLSRDLRYEYNYGSGKIEAIAALLCDSLILCGILLMTGLSVHQLIRPAQPSDLLIAVVGLKVINVIVDAVFFREQYRIRKENGGAIARSSYAAVLGALLTDIATLLSLLVAWLFRGEPLSWYFSPVVCILLAGYLMVGCVKRIRGALNELTDKTLPEEMQLKILRVLAGFHRCYTQLHFVKSHRSGSEVRVDLILAFEKETTFGEIVALKGQIQEKLEALIENCTVNIVVREESGIPAETDWKRAEDEDLSSK